ncbi:MAG: phosphomethylpyrimidine synthase ThiC [Tannerella sp.]|nr:phosphomethylpyrimidine synthase ThiC [Tannerella sp.]
MEKVYVEGEINNIRVGMCQINLSDTIVKKEDETFLVKKNSPVILYDTSGPYGDPSFETDYNTGLPCVRETWYARRKDIVRQTVSDGSAAKKVTFRAREGKCITQMYYAKKRMISPEMEYVAIRENQQVEALGLKSYITPDFVRKEIASGRAVIPANVNHVEIEPMIIGSRFLVKINSNINVGKDFSETDYEKIRLNCTLGVDTLMDISPGDIPQESRNRLIRNSPVPVGTPPVYQALAKVGGHVEDLSWAVFRDTLIEQLEQGVDFISVHAAMKRKHSKMISHRLTGIVSHAGRIVSEWMNTHKEENFLNTHFSEICEIAASYDAVISIGSGLRPGSVYDANDRAHLAELSEMRELVEVAWKQHAQVMAEGPGHIPMNKIEPYMKEYRYICKGVPFFSPGMVTSDLAIGHEHIAAAIGGAQMAWFGASLIGGLKSQVDLTDRKDVQTNLLSYKIAAHSADLAKGHPGAQVRDNAFSKARQENREQDWRKLSFHA